MDKKTQIDSRGKRIGKFVLKTIVYFDGPYLFV